MLKTIVRGSELLEFGVPLEAPGLFRDSWADALTMAKKPVIHASEIEIVLDLVGQSGPLARALEALSTEQHAVLERRYGLSSGTPDPDPVIAADLEMSSHEVEQVEDEALRRFFTPDTSEK